MSDPRSELTILTYGRQLIDCTKYRLGFGRDQALTDAKTIDAGPLAQQRSNREFIEAV